jgi:hypothetical protein
LHQAGNRLGNISYVASLQCSNCYDLLIDAATYVLQAHMLSQELLTLPQGPLPPSMASLAAQSHAKRSVLAPLLCVASSVDALGVLRAGSGFFQSSGGEAGGYAPSGGAKVNRAQVAAGLSSL